ncbi:MAG TPA: hypothetical protein VKZ43_03080 [Trueperaceae bacterium]|nr:hypothetical protein [Trueperaceae bacterium]
MRRERDVNYAALLGVIAAASFLAPLVADLGVRLGLDDSAFAPVSLLVAVVIVVVWLAVGHDNST